MKQLLYLLPLLVVPNMLSAVKIGVSKPSTTTTIATPPNTTTTNAPTTTIMTTTQEELYSTTTTDDFTTLSSTLPSATTSTTEATKPIFVLSQFPPRKTKTSIRTTTTKSPLATTTTTTTTTTTARPVEEITTPEPSAFVQSSGSYYCACNLLPAACDINCCCDRDCSKQALQVFNCFAAAGQTTPHSRWQDFRYQYGLPSCKINDGWLCVFRTNIAPTREKVKSPNMDSTHFNKWPSLLPMTEETTVEHKDFYAYGEPLRLLNMETLELQTFDLPYAFKPPHCQLEEPVRHLSSQKTSCLLRNLTELQAVKHKLLQLVATTKLLTKPNVQAHELEEVEANLLQFQVQSCRQAAESKQCVNLPLENITVTNARENSYLMAVSIKIVHNYTNIIACALELQERTLNKESESILSLWQTYVVEFIYRNYTELPQDAKFDLHNLESPEKAVSGPLGYLLGAPIIMAKFIANNESQELPTHNRVLSYFHTNATQLRAEHSLRLLTQRQEVCYKSDNREQLISYGISALQQCKLRLGNEPVATSGQLHDVNFTAICEKLQHLAWQQLYPEWHEQQLSTELYISQRGRPQNQSDKWTPLHVRNYEYTPITAQYQEQAHSFTCYNIILSVSFEFFVGTFMVNDIPQQAAVQQAVLLVGPRHDLEFSVHELLEVPLSMSVMFYDYTKEPAADGANKTCSACGLLVYLCLLLAIKISAINV